MRTSRGLRVTSLVVLSPVILILLSLLTILTTTLFSQLQSLCPPLFTTTPSLTSTLSFNDPLSGNSNDTLLLPTDDTNSPSYSSTSDSTVTITKSANTPNHYQHHHHHHRSSSLLHSWLKRGRCTKKNSSSLWSVCGLFLLFGYICLHKSHVPKRQSIIRLTSGTCLAMSNWSKKVMDYLWTGQQDSRELSATDMVWINDAPKLRNNNNGGTKTSYAKGKDQHTRTTKPSGTSMKHPIKKTRKQPQHHNQRPTNTKCSSESSHKQSFSTDTMEQDHVDFNDWINVGDKKKKDTNTDTMESVQQAITYDEDNLTPVDFDDDDKTVVEELDPMKSHTTPATSDDETELDSPCLSTTETNTTHHHHYFHHHHYHCHDHHHLEPVIRNWYSPFSTGLDIDILPPRSDPLTQLDPMQLRKQDTLPSSHYLNQQFYDNFSLLQNHPFVNDPTRLQPHPPATLPLGAIGQHSPTSSVQNSKQRTYSLFNSY